jgi:hypothetical protein
MLNILPQARLSHIGSFRDGRRSDNELLFQNSLDLEDSDVFLVDPMLPRAAALQTRDSIKMAAPLSAHRVARLRDWRQVLPQSHPSTCSWRARDKLNQRAYIVQDLACRDRYCEREARKPRPYQTLTGLCSVSDLKQASTIF